MLKYSKQSQLQYRRKKILDHVKISEHDLQQMCEDYLNMINAKFIRFPDSIYRTIFGMGSNVSPKTKQFIASFIKGVPDLILLKQKFEETIALCIELKVGKNKMSQGQKDFSKRIKVHEVRDFDTFKKLVDEFYF